MILDPGHFHSALVQKFTRPGVAQRVHVYAPLGEELLDYLHRVAAFNHRADDPTHWELDVCAGANYRDRFAREVPGHAAVVAGRNRSKIDHLTTVVNAACHALVDKPWIISSADLPKLAEALRQAELREVLVWDVMTERFEVTNRLLRELVNDAEVCGNLLAGTVDEPAVTFESMHHLKKTVSEIPLRRPIWWFDPEVAGYGLADVGTHLVDLALWTLFPEQVLDPERDVRMWDARVWPTLLPLDQFQELTGQSPVPTDLYDRWGNGEMLLYPGNGTATFSLRGVHVRITTGWDVEALAGSGDTSEAVVRGSRAKLVARPMPRPDGHHPVELIVDPNTATDRPDLTRTVQQRCSQWQRRYPGISAEDHGTYISILIPDSLRTDHEQHFTDVLDEFVRYIHNPRHVPPWESANLYTKYFITTTALDLALQKQGSYKTAPRG
jgi:hypothetical protein